ncbi:EF-hand calcium-binding domain-containing protein 7-like isoform X9 [Mya arenaria]|uniref:EF-hand calcium-binding domain-containing protein 7-like isoform X9 n=1 Tax=Mya arenaria TaxID=6604 RepID=UPI0022E71178|nr:EF-hand calcium-binding domain-containing protein 7-like isoform X9 [Mya arenaria]
MSRRSSHQGEGSEFFLECKAAFLAIFDEIEDKIESKKRLNDLLQQSGRNPNKARLDKYWPSGTDKLQFDDFVEICRKEPVTSADDLMKAFRKIDLNGDGYISLDELFKIMNAQGESMSREDVKKMIDEVDDNKDGRLDYKEHPALWKDRVYYEEFTNMIMKTTEDSKKFSQKMMEKKEKRRQRGDRYKASEANTSKTLDTSEQKPVNNQNETVKEPDSKHDEHTEIEHDHSDKAESESHVDKEKTTGDISKRRDSMGSKTSLRNEGGQSHVDKGSYSEAEKDSETSEKPKTISRRDSVSSKESVDIGRKEKGSKGTPRKELDPKNDKPPIPDNPKTPRSGAISHRSKGETPRESGRRLSKGDKSEMAGTSKEDGPKPSPRVIKRDQAAKGKSSSKAGKMLDSRTLKDWVHHTSKGCFFYEDDEIVSHVFTMKLTQDTSVYLTAHPIQEPECLEVTSSEPVDTAILVFDESGKLLHWSEDRDSKGTYYLKCELSSGEYQVVPYTTGCRFKQRASDKQNTMKEAKLVKMADEKVQITVNFRKALEDIFDLCDLDNNGTMSRDEFNWFNLRTSGEELGEDEWEVVEERTELSNGEITKEGFIALNEMEAEDAQGDVEDLWITLSSMGLNKGLIMDEACPYRLDVYVESPGRKRTTLKVSGIESLQRPEYVTEICKYTIDLAGDPHRIRNMKDLYLYTYKNELRATIVVDNRSRSNVNLGVDCSNSKNVVSNHPDLDHTLDIDPQSTMIAHHLVPKSELSDWSVSCSETINK